MGWGWIIGGILIGGGIGYYLAVKVAMTEMPETGRVSSMALGGMPLQWSVAGAASSLMATDADMGSSLAVQASGHGARLCCLHRRR